MKKFIAFDSYEKIADSYCKLVYTKPHNAYLERPGTLELLPDNIEGKKILDAGAGPGIVHEYMVNKGAEVISVDACPQMVNNAKAKLGEDSNIILHDIQEPLTFLNDSELDIVYSSLVMDYIEDIYELYIEINRVLKPGGLFIFSMEHPFNKMKFSENKNYFETEQLSIKWSGFKDVVFMPTIRRPLQEYFDALHKASFLTEQFIEHTPTKEFEQADKELYEKVKRNPSFFAIRARKER